MRRRTTVVGCSLGKIDIIDDKKIVNLANKVVEQVNKELDSKKTKWNVNQLESIVLPEMKMLSKAHADENAFFIFLSENKMLESTYLIIDSLNGLNKSNLGKTILRLQNRIDKAMKRTKRPT